MLKAFKILKEEKVFEMPDRYSVVVADLEAPDGRHTQWSCVSWKDIAVVLAMDGNHNVYLKKEWRLNRRDSVWEVASGIVKEDNPTEEQIVNLAQNEIQEEIGMKAGMIKKLLTFYPMNHVRCRIHLYLATDLAESKLSGDEFEFLETQKLPFDQAYDLVVNQQKPTAQNALIFLLARQELGL